MSMMEWAKREVEIASKRERGDKPESEWDYGCACYDSALKAFESLCGDGHSGFSIGITKGILNRLIERKPLRANAELCLLGVRGKPKRMDAGVHSVIMSHIEEHSKKPAETRDRIVKLMAGGGLPKIELFARQSIDGWDCWGNEV